MHDDANIPDAHSGRGCWAAGGQSDEGQWRGGRLNIPEGSQDPSVGQNSVYMLGLSDT